MGSIGTGNFSDYKNFPRAIKGVTGKHPTPILAV